MRSFTFLCTISFVISSALHAQQITDAESCGYIKTAFPKANLKELEMKYDELTDKRTVASKGPSLMSSVIWNPQLFAEATGKDGALSDVVMRYTHTQVIMKASDQVRPLLSNDIKFYILADTVRHVLDAKPSSYVTKTDPPMGPLPGYFYETVVFNVSPTSIRQIAESKSLKMRAGETNVNFPSDRLVKGAQAFLLGKACGWNSQ